MSDEKPFMKSGIRDNLRRGTVHDFLQNAIQNGSTLSVVSAYFTIYAYEKLQHSLDHNTVFIRNNHDIRYGCMNVKQILDLFEVTTEGKTEVIDKLCLWFDKATEHGQNMEHYNELLNTVVKHITSSHTKTQKKGLKRGGDRNFKLTNSSKTPKSTSDFELVTWLVIN